MAAASADPAGLARAPRSRTWWFEWRNRTETGDTAAFRAHYSIWGADSLAVQSLTFWKRHGIEPAPERIRKTPWKEFLRQHWDLIVAADFFTVEVWPTKGLQRFIVLFFLELSTRRVEIAGISARANGLWMSQIARTPTDSVDGLLTGKRYLMHDRDPLFTDEFLGTLKDAGVQSVKLPPRSPNLNAHAERFVRSIKESCLERLILFGETSLGIAIQNFIAHYHSERNHQGLGNRLIQPERDHLVNRGAVQCRERLGGTLNYFELRPDRAMRKVRQSDERRLGDTSSVRLVLAATEVVTSAGRAASVNMGGPLANSDQTA